MKDLKLNETFHAHAEDDIDFLLDEVERLEDMLNTHAPHGRNYTNQQYVDLLHENQKLRDEIQMSEELLYDLLLLNQERGSQLKLR